MRNILKKPKAKIEDTNSKYYKFNLKENPFPTTPAINKDNNDIRYNGKIYEQKIREKEYKKIEKNFLSVSQNNPNHLRLGFILDDSYVGRGNGKSTFSLNLLESINKNYCLDISNDLNKCFGIYLSPEPSGRTKTFYSFIDLFFEAILDLNIIPYCLASLRLDAILSDFAEFDIEKEFENEEDIIKKLNDHNWYKNKDIKIPDVTRTILKNEYLGKLTAGFPLLRDKKQYNWVGLTSQEHFKKYYFERLKKGKERLTFIFTDLVNLFLASGFNGVYIMVDDFERIPDFQSDRQKREFALELRTNLFDGISENAKIGFYNFILILHAGVSRLIGKAWGDTGMEQRSSLSAENYNSSHIIVFNKLTHEDAILLIKKYLAAYRIENGRNDLSPFDEDAISLISEKSELNAASILAKAYQLIEKAIEANVSRIDRDFVEQIFGSSSKVDEQIMDDFANETSTNLFKKSKGE